MHPLADDRRDDARAADGVVLRVVLVVDRLGVGAGGIREVDLAFDTARGDTALTASPCVHVPGIVGSVRAAHEEVVADAGDPDGDRLAEAAVPASGGDAQLLRSPDAVELVARPGAHASILTPGLDSGDPL